MAIRTSTSRQTDVACVQLAPVFGDVDGNRTRAAAAIEAAADDGAQLVVLPELCTTGYAFGDASQARELGEPADGPTLEQWRTLAHARRVVVIGGFCEIDPAGGHSYNSAAIADADGRLSVYRKPHLWDREQLIFEPGGRPPMVVATEIGRIGIAICYDAFFPEFTRTLALAGAELIAVPMNSPIMDAAAAREQPLALEVVLALATANVNRVFVAQADRVGPERGIEWAGASVICDPDGRLAAGPIDDRSQPSTLHARCDLNIARDKRLGARNDVFADRRTDLYWTSTTNHTTIKESVN